MNSEFQEMLIAKATELTNSGFDVSSPQKGPQYDFLATPADIAVYGGAAGAGKTYALLLEAMRHIQRPEFYAVIFRRTYPQITSPGGLWDTARGLFGPYCTTKREATLEYFFAPSSRIKFAHMQYESDVHQWDGSQIPLICFDQLEHFTYKQFFYMLSRNRSTCGVKPYIRATCNPDPDHWLRKFMAWWIDDDTGYPLDERAGAIRWFITINDITYWADDPETLKRDHGAESMPKSFTFIPGKLQDNQILMDIDPGYLGNLRAQSKVFRERLERGNWNARESAGEFFNRNWFGIVPAAPKLLDIVRYWDRAATEVPEGAQSEASWTAGIKMGVTKDGEFYILHCDRFRKKPLGVERSILNTASQDGKKVRIGIEGDPGQAGKAEAQHYIRSLAGYNATINTVRESKGARARPYSAQCEAGNVYLVEGSWNEDFLIEHHNFDGSDNCEADQVDASSGAFHLLTAKRRISDTW